MIKKDETTTPLADRMRPSDLSEFVGQKEVVGEDSLLYRAISSGQIPSIIFWGPPGSGKTTLAHIIARKARAEFYQVSAVVAGLKDLREIIKKSEDNQKNDKKTLLFIDEIHRWNKAQQDALLPYVEKGTIILIGATTENPSFEVRPALISRMRVFTLSRLDKDEIVEVIKRALSDRKNGLGGENIKMDEEAMDFLSGMSNGDSRLALNVLEYVSSISKEISKRDVGQAIEKVNLVYDKDGEEHYNIISALHKSMRGSDPDAALYWLARMLEAGEDPVYVARRIVRFASEDVGLANSRALEQAVAAFRAAQMIGMPECNVILAQAVVYMAKCQKSNELYRAYKEAARDAQEKGNLPVPLHLRNAPTKMMRDMGYSKGYKYSPDHDYSEDQDYLPDDLTGRKYIK